MPKPGMFGSSTLGDLIAKSLKPTTQNDVAAALGMRRSKPAIQPFAHPKDLRPSKGNEAYWRAKLANQGQIAATKPTFSEKTEGTLGEILGKALGEQYGRHVAKRAMAPLNDWTPVGNVTGMEEGAKTAYHGLTRGDLASGALGAGVFALNAIPFGGAVKRQGENALMALMRDEAGAIRAYHGSPHDFDKFEWSPRTRGTGEGAQAYGDGLYFAENRAVAEDYRKQLAGYGHTYSIDGEDFGRINDLPSARQAYAKLAPDLSALKQVDERAPAFFDSYGPAALGSVVRGIDYTSSKPLEELLTNQAALHRQLAERASDPRDRAEQLGKAIIAETMSRRTAMGRPGHVYEVNIGAEPEDFLDYDAPLIGQSDAALSAANKIFDPGWDTGAKWAADFKPTGAMLVGPHRGSEGQRRAEIMRSVGIPGVRFLDQGSRGSFANRIDPDFTPTSNYVVFDDSLIDILNKF